MADPSSTGPSTVPSARSSSGPSRALIAALAATVLFAAAAVVVLLLTRGGGGSAPPILTTPESTSAITLGPTTTAAVSTTVAAVTTTAPPTAAATTVVAADQQRIVVLDRATGSVVRTLFDLGPSQPDDVSPSSVAGLALSRDGRTAFFDAVDAVGQGAMHRVPVAGGTVEDLGAGHAPTPSPDGAVLAFVRGADANADANGLDTLVLRDADAHERTIALGTGTCGTLAFSPDGTRLAVDACESGEPTTVLDVDLAAGRATPLTPPAGVAWTSPAFRPDGTLTLAEDRAGGTVVVTIDVGSAGQGSRVTGTVLRRDATTLVSMDWDAGANLLFCEADGAVYAVTAGQLPTLVGRGYQAAAW